MASDAPGASDAGAKRAMDDLAKLVAQAEAHEARGEYREAAELTARAMAEAHREYVRSKVPGVQLLRQPTLAMPRYSYVERYKERLRARVDWQRWERCSRALPSGGSREWEDGGDEEEEDGAGASAATATSGSPPIAAIAEEEEGGPSELPQADWQPETLAKRQIEAVGGSGQVVLEHKCCNGERVELAIAQTDIAERVERLFNRDVKSTIRALLDGSDPNICSRAYTHEEIARWFLTADSLSKNRIGDFLGGSKPDAIQTLEAFVMQIDFTGMPSFDEALRFFLSLFRLPGESQQIDRIFTFFGKRYHECTESTFRSEDTPYVLAFALLMLNTDAHNENIAADKKMKLDGFLKNNRGIDAGENLPEAFLTELYHSIVLNEIRIEQREFIAKSIMEGWLNKQGGRIKTWKKRYVILSGAVLYYFKKHNDPSPAGFVPLEGILVHQLSDKRIFELRPKVLSAQGGIKSVRMDEGGKGAFKVGNHKQFRFRVLGDAEEAARWVQAVQEHAVSAQVRDTPSQKEEAKRAGLSFFRSKKVK
jgi:cytohesin